MTNTLPHVTLFTDGGCPPTADGKRPTFGAWAAVIRYQDTYRTVSGHIAGSYITPQRCELWAVIEGLTALREPCAVTVHTDSKWLIENADNRYHRGNVDLWDGLRVLRERHEVTFKWVKSHSGDFDNELAHAAVTRELKWQKENRR